MGFGLLLCAYFLFTFMSAGVGDYCFITYLVGALIAIRAVSGLKDYNPRFSWLYPFIALYAFLAVYYVTLTVDDLFLLGLPLRGAVVAAAVNWVDFLCELGFAVFALWSCAELAGSVGLQKHRTRAWRNLVFVGIWGVAQIVLLAVPSLAAAGNQTLVKVLFLYVLVVYFLNALLFYSCFSSICPKGEEFGKPSKPSRLRFINEMNRKLDEKNERARLEYEQNLAAKNRKFSAKNNNRQHKKKK